MAVLLWTHCSQGSAALLRALRARDDGAGPSRPAGVYWPPTPKGVQATVPIPELQRRYLMVITGHSSGIPQAMWLSSRGVWKLVSQGPEACRVTHRTEASHLVAANASNSHYLSNGE